MRFVFRYRVTLRYSFIIRSRIAILLSTSLANPRFCLGYRNLGIIHAEQGDAAKAAENFGLYAKHCPDSPDAQFRLGVALLKTGEKAGAREAFEKCATPIPEADGERGAGLSKGCRQVQDRALLEECRRYRQLMAAE